jgi:hypothetical protein
VEKGLAQQVNSQYKGMTVDVLQKYRKVIPFVIGGIL